MRTYAHACATLGLVSLFCFILTNLALLDIARGEPDLVNEWRVVKIGVLPILLFHVMAIVALFRVAKSMQQRR